LPKIAARLNVTTDILLGCDPDTDTFDLSEFNREWNSVDTEEGRIALALEWDKRYPDRDRVLFLMCNSITQLPEDVREKYLPLLYEKCAVIAEKSTEQFLRDGAIHMMCTYVGDDELDRWISMCPKNYSNISGEIIEERLWETGDHSRSRVRFDANNLSLILHILFRRNRNYNMPEKSAEWCRFRLNLLRFFGDGKVPLGWAPAAAKLSLGEAAALFASGEREEGYMALERAFEFYEKIYDIPAGTEMDLGCPALFGEIKVRRSQLCVLMPDPDAEGGYREEKCIELHELVRAELNLLHALTCFAGWEWFNSVRDEDRFKEYVARAKKMYGDFEE